MASPSFFDDIRSTYGNATHSIIKQTTRLQECLTRLQNRRRFLTKCRSNGVFPQHIQVHIPCIQQIYEQHTNFSRQADRVTKRLKKSILSLEIRITHSAIKDKEHLLRTNCRILEDTLPAPVYQRYKLLEWQRQQRLDQRIKTINQKKLRNLMIKHNFGLQAHTDQVKSTTVVNLTERHIPEGTVNLLALGPKFAIDPPRSHRQTFINLITDTEYILTNVYKDNDDVRNEKRQRANNILSNFSNSPSHTCSQGTSFFQKEYETTRKWLKNNPDVLVTLSDKGNKTVFINKQDYERKMLHMLGDGDIYQVVARDPTKGLINKHNKLIKTITEEGGLTQEVGKTLCCRNGVLGRIYGQVKLHKQNKPLRPIVSTLGTVMYKTAKYITKILSPLVGSSPYDAGDSFQLAEKLKSLTVPPSHVMVSFDVVSMFTNIPIELVLQLIDEKYNDIAQFTTLNKKQLLDVITFICESCYFTYENQIYRQKNGLAMGMSLSPLLADVVLNRLLEVVLQQLNNVWFITRYVDDLFLIVPSHEVDQILLQFNSFHQNIRFTMEIENQRTMNFLELTVTRREDASLAISWYRKPTSSLRYLNFYSNHTITQKRNIITMLNKRLQTFSDASSLLSQQKEVQRILMNNDYPKCFINKYLGKPLPDAIDPVSRDIQSTETQDVVTQNPPKIYYKLPYVEGLSYRLRRVLDAENVELVFYHTHTIGKLYSNTKSAIALNRQSNLVYSIPCNCGSIYIGQTMQHLGDRIQQHRYSLNRLRNGTLTVGQNTGITQHAATFPDHIIQFEEVRIVDRESNYHRRLVKEAIHITKTQDRLNLQSDIRDNVINIVYANVIGRLC